MNVQQTISNNNLFWIEVYTKNNKSVKFEKKSAYDMSKISYALNKLKISHDIGFYKLGKVVAIWRF